MTEAASLNFGPAWLRGGEFQTGSGGGGGAAGGGGGNSFFDTGNHTSGNHRSALQFCIAKKNPIFFNFWIVIDDPDKIPVLCIAYKTESRCLK